MVPTIITSTCLISLDSSSCYLKSSWESIYIYSLFIMDSHPPMVLALAFILIIIINLSFLVLLHLSETNLLCTNVRDETQKWVRFVSSMMMQGFLEEHQQHHLHHFLAWQPYYRFDLIGENICQP